MKRNFLLMLLLTLLPFTAWAAEPQAITGLKYTGTNQTAITAGSDAGVQYRYAITSANGTAKPSWSQSSTSLPTINGAGTYRVYWASRSGGAVRETNEWNVQNHYVTVIVAKAYPVVSLYGFSIDYGAPEPTVNTMPTTSYAFDADGTNLTWNNVRTFLSWSRSSGSMDAGSYPYTLIVASGGTNNNYEIKINPVGELEIAAVDGTFTTTPAGKASGSSEKYDATDKTLSDLIATPAVYSGGTVEYSADGLAWSEDMSSVVVGKDADTYTIYYRGNGDKNHNDIAGGNFNVYIDQAEATLAIADVEDTYAYSKDLAITPSFTCEDANYDGTAATYSYKKGSTSMAFDKSAGEWTVTVEVAATKNYKKATASKTFTVTPKALTEDMFSLADFGAKERVYTGSAIYVGNPWSYEGVKLAEGAGKDFTVVITKGGSTISASEVENVGEYTFTFTGRNNYSGNYPVVLKVTPADLEVTAGTVLNAPFNNGPQALITAEPIFKFKGSTVPGTLTYSYGTKTKVAFAAVEETNAGDYAITYSFNAGDNFNAITDAELGTAKITQADNAIDALWADVADVTYPTAPVITTPTDAFGNDATLTYTRNGEAAAAPGVGEYWHAGAWTVTATVEETTNYKKATATKTFTVSKAALNLGVDGKAVDWADGKTYEWETVVKDLVSSGDWVGPEIGNEAAQAAILAEGLIITGITDELLAGDAGTYPITIKEKLDADINYSIKAWNHEVNFIINKVDATLAGLTAKNRTFDGNPAALVEVTSLAVGGTAKYFVGDAAPAEDSDSWTTTVPEETDADTYNVWQMVEGDKNHNNVVAAVAVEVTIAKEDINNATFALSSTEENWTGADFYPVVKVVPTLPLTSDDYTVTVKNGEGETVTEMKDAGIYTFYLTATDDGNYMNDVSATFEIKAVPTSVVAPIALNPTFTGVAQDLVEAGVPTGGEIVYSLSETGTYTADIPQGVDVDDYTVWYKVEPDGNHTAVAAASVPAKILAKKLTKDMFVFNTVSTTFNGKDQLGVFDYDIAASEEFLKGKDFYVIPEDDTMIDAGVYQFKFIGKENYTGTFDVTFTINKATATLVAPEAINLTYNGEDQILVKAGTTDAVAGTTSRPAGTIKYQVTSGNDVVVPWTEDINEVVGKNAADYQVKYQFIASENYTNPDVPGTVDTKILKADIAYMLSNAEKTWDGEAFKEEEVAKVFTLFAGKLFGDDAYNVPFTLSLPEDYRDAGTYNFKKGVYTYKTDAPENYNVNFTGEAEIVINKADIKATDYVAPAEKDVMTFNAEAQKLVEAGEVKTTYQYPEMEEAEPIAKILYFEGETAPAEDDEASWTTDVPEETNANAAEEVYTVWYMVKGDDNHNNIAPKKLTAKIQPKVWDAQLAFDDATVAYNTLDQMPNTELKDKVSPEEVTTLEKGTDYTLTINYTPANSTEFTALVEPKLINAGKYEFEYKGINNYAGAEAKATITIEPVKLAKVTINEKNGGLITEYEEKSVVYNTEDQKPTLALKYMYFEDEEDETPKAAEDLVAGKDFTVAAEDEMINAGEYTFTFTAVAGGNYTGETTATFEIKKKEVVAEVVPESAKKTYNGLAGFATLLGAEPVAIKLSYNNPYPNDKFEFVYDNTAFAVADDAIDAGFYDMTVDADKIVADNYKAVIDNAEFEIEKATLLINWKDGVTATKVYGAEDPELVTADNVATAGAVNATDQARILNCIVATYEGENVGKYDITLAADDEADDADVLENYAYTINNEFGKQAFEITAAKIKVSLATQEKPYNGQNAAPDVTASTLIITGLLNGEKKEDVITEFPVAKVNGGEEAVVAGTYDVELSGGKFANYEVEEYLPSVITIVKAQVVASIEPLKVFAGTPAADIEPEFTVTCGDEDYSEFFKVVVNGEYQDKNGLIKGSGTYADGLVLVIDNLQDAANITGWNNVKGELTVIATVELSDEEDFVSEAKKGVNVSFTERSINTNNWNVVALPFEASIAQISEAFGYAAVDRLNKKAADGNIHFEVVTSGTIPAFEPFIIKTTDDEDLVKENFTDVVFESVNIEAWDGTNNYVEDAAQNKFWGTFQASTEIYGQKYWYMSKGAWKDARNFTAEKPITLKPFRAFVEFDEKNVAAGARIYIEEPDGTETAIDAVEFNQMVNGDTYTVDGKKVSNTAQKGIYIQNGKKIAVK